MLVGDENSGLSRKYVNYGQKSFITLAPGQCKTFYGCNLLIFVINLTACPWPFQFSLMFVNKARSLP
jgi:hypothetical protein